MINILRISISIFFLLLIEMYACNSQSKHHGFKSGSNYDFEVLYNYQGTEIIKEDKYRFKYPSDSLFIFFESEFIDDTLTLEENGKVIYSNLDLNTDPSSGIAKVIIRKGMGEIKNLGIRINYGSLIFVELNDIKNNILGVRYEKDKIQVVFYKKAPIFY